MKKLLSVLFVALLPLLLWPIETSAWLGFTWNSTAVAGCACPNWTAPSGNLQSSTSFSGATLTNVTPFLNDAASPDCANHFSTFVENTSNGAHEINLTSGPFSVSLSGAQMTYRVLMAPAAGTRTVDVQISNQGTGYLYFNVSPSTGIVNVSQNNNGFASSIVAMTIPVQGGGYELVVSAAGVTATTLNIQHFMDNATGAGNTYTGDGVSGINLWGESVSTP